MLRLSKTNGAAYDYLSIGTASHTYAASTAFTIGQTVTVGDYTYRCTVAGTTAASAPTWPTVTDATVTDGSVTWRCESLASNPTSVSVTLDNTGTPATITSDPVTLYLVARSYNYTGIAMTLVNEQTDRNWQLSADGTTWEESLDSTALPAMDATSTDQLKTIYARCVVGNAGTVATGIYTVPDIQTTATENPA